MGGFCSSYSENSFDIRRSNLHKKSQATTSINPHIIFKRIPDPPLYPHNNKGWIIDATEKYYLVYGLQLTAGEEILDKTNTFIYDYQIYLLPEMVLLDEGIATIDSDAFPFFCYKNKLYFFPNSMGDFYVYDLKTQKTTQENFINLSCRLLLYFEFNADHEVAYVIFKNDINSKTEELINVDNTKIFSNSLHKNTPILVKIWSPTQVLVAIQESSSTCVYESSIHGLNKVLTIQQLLSSNEIIFDKFYDSIWYCSKDVGLIQKKITDNCEETYSFKDEASTIYKSFYNTNLYIETVKGLRFKFCIESKKFEMHEEDKKFNEIKFGYHFANNDYELFIKDNVLAICQSTSGANFLIHPGQINFSYIIDKSYALIATPFCLAYVHILVKKIICVFFFSQIHAVSVSPCGKHLLFGYIKSEDCWACLWSIHDKKPLLNEPIIDYPSITKSCATSLPIFIGVYEKSIFCFLSAEDKHEFAFKNVVKDIIFNEKKKMLIVIFAQEKSLVMINVHTRERVSLEIEHTEISIGDSILTCLPQEEFLFFSEIVNGHLNIVSYNLDEKKIMTTCSFDCNIVKQIVADDEILIFKEETRNEDKEDIDFLIMDIINFKSQSHTKCRILIPKNFESFSYSNQNKLIMLSNKMSFQVLSLHN